MFVSNTDRVRVEIQNQIVAGTLAPGITLDEGLLSKQFSVSRTPVREALLQLSIEGYIKIVPRSGIYVVRLSNRELIEMTETLAHAEGLCARLVALRINDPQMKILTVLHKDGKKAVDNKDPVAYAQSNKAFHEFFYACCGNSYLVEHILGIRKRTNPYHQRGFHVLDRLTASWMEHDRLFTAVLAGDANAASHEATAHVLSRMAVLVEPDTAADAQRWPAAASAWSGDGADIPERLEPLTRLH